MYSVYGLVDPRTQEVRYVGMAKDVHKRYAQHLLYPHKNAAKTVWLTDLKEVGLIPSLIVLETNIKDSQAHERERHWIQHYLDQGIQLTNIMNVIKHTTPKIVKQIKPVKRSERSGKTFVWVDPDKPLPQIGEEVDQEWADGLHRIKIHRIIRVYTRLDGSKQLLVDAAWHRIMVVK